MPMLSKDNRERWETRGRGDLAPPPFFLTGSEFALRAYFGSCVRARMTHGHGVASFFFASESPLLCRDGSEAARNMLWLEVIAVRRGARVFSHRLILRHPQQRCESVFPLVARRGVRVFPRWLGVLIRLSL
jgi:hypothetical protein